MSFVLDHYFSSRLKKGDKFAKKLADKIESDFFQGPYKFYDSQITTEKFEELGDLVYGEDKPVANTKDKTKAAEILGEMFAAGKSFYLVISGFNPKPKDKEAKNFLKCFLGMGHFLFLFSQEEMVLQLDLGTGPNGFEIGDFKLKYGVLIEETTASIDFLKEEPFFVSFLKDLLGNGFKSASKGDYWGEYDY